MSSRLNPREYDLGELRDAVRENPRRADDRRRTDSRRGRPGDREREASAPGADGRRGEHRPGEAPDDGVRPDESGDGVEGDGTGDEDDRATARLRGRETRGDGRHEHPVLRAVRDARRRRWSADGRGRFRSEPLEPTGAPSIASPPLDLELLSQSPRDDAGRPYLASVPEGYGAQLEVFEWLEGLLAKCGREATAEALSYYEALGWLSEGSREHLETFTAGLTAAEPTDPRPLDVDDHRQSLLYVARLAHRVDR